MTTLIAIQNDNWCVIAAESQSTFNERAMDCSPVGKISINGEYLIAAAGATRGTNILAFGWNPPTPSGDLDKFVTRKFIPSMRKTFIASGYDMKADGQEATFDNEILVAVRGTIYFIDESYGWERCGTKLYGSGTGADYALGALEALGARSLTNYEDAITMAESAIKVATHLDIYSGGIVQVAVQTKEGKNFIAQFD